MPTIIANIDGAAKERAKKKAEKLGISQQKLAALAIEFAMSDDRYEDFESYAVKETSHLFDDDVSDDGGELTDDVDLLSGVRPESTEDLPGKEPTEEDLEEAQNQTESKTFREMLEEIDDL